MELSGLGPLCLPLRTTIADRSQGVEYKDCSGSEVIKLSSCNSTEHEIYHAYKC